MALKTVPTYKTIYPIYHQQLVNGMVNIFPVQYWISLYCLFGNVGTKNVCKQKKRTI